MTDQIGVPGRPSVAGPRQGPGAQAAAFERARHLALAQMVARWARECPEKTALVLGADRVSYRRLDERTNQVAHLLSELGVQRGDRVAVVMGNRVEFLEVVFACLKLGACVVPVNTRLLSAEVSHLLADSGAVGVVGDLSGLATTAATLEAGALAFLLSVDDTDAYAGRIASQPVEPPSFVVQAHEPAFIMYTSGTTGPPKGAVLTHQNLWLQSAAWVRRNSATPDDVWMSGVPLFHIAAFNALLPMLSVGATFVIAPSVAFDAEHTLSLLRDNAVTMCAFVPTQWHALCLSPAAEQFDVSIVRTLFWGASQSPLPTLQLMARTFPHSRIVNSYGQTEMSGSSFFLDGDDAVRKMGSVGRPNPEVETALVDPAGLPVAVGDVGEIVFRGPAVMAGYHGDPEATAEALRGGWFHTGDLARQDDEGYTYVVDRLKDVIISGGENIYPAEIEAVLSCLEGIAEVAVVGVAHPKWVESPLAVIVLTSDATLSEATVLEHCRVSLAGYKRPQAVKFVDRLPRNASGKVLKPELRRNWRQLLTPGPATPGTPDNAGAPL